MAELFHTTVRVFFRKEGRIKYISHLDIVRCVSRALKRSKLPVWHTLGFNPHIYITFALPLALGYESTCESMDFRLTEEQPMETVVSRLNEVFPEGLTAYAAAPAVQKPEEIAWADYEITQEFDRFGGDDVAAALEKWCGRSEIPVRKKGKKGERVIDAAPHFQIQKVEAQGNSLHFDMRAAAGSTLNINPTLLLDAFAEETGFRADWMRVVRTAILTKKLKNFK